MRRLTAAWGETVLGWFGSWQNIGKRLLESLRNWFWPAESFERRSGPGERVTLDST